MLASRLGLRTAARATTRSTITFRPRIQLPRTQQRWATYQRFPGRGGPSGGRQQTYSGFQPFARAQHIWYNYRAAVLVTGGAGGAFYVYNLEEVPITHRRRFNCISPEQEKALMSGGAYEQMLQQFRGKILPESHPYTQLVAKVVERLLPSVGSLAGDEWRVHVVDDPNMANAFVMPGGKVFVFTGLLPIAQDENGLAAVLGHEIAHNVAHHSAERLSRSLPIMVISVLGSMLFDVSGGLSQYVTSLVLELPNGRAQETEADHIGLLMMAQSCYDPDQVPALWSRMAEYEKKHGGAPPQFLSTHPSSFNRGDTIRKWLPEAHAKYQESECQATSRHIEDFRKTFQSQQGRGGRGQIIPIQSNSSDDDWF